MQEAGELAATTAKLLNVSEFTSIDDATSALVSSLQAFNRDGEDVGQRAEEIVDILNNVGNKYPVATNELAQGLETSAAALVAANNSIEEQVALLSAGNATMQDISTVASGLKIVAARLRGTTTDIDDDADSAITNVSKLEAKIKALTKEANGGQGIDIIDEQGNYKSTYEILKAISKIYDKMDDVSQASLLELIAGKNRSSVVAAILQNSEILENSYKDALNSVGSADKELNTYLNSIQGKIDKFNNAVQTMWMNFISSDVVKKIVDFGTAVVNLIDKIGAANVALALFASYITVKIKFGGILKALGQLINLIKGIQISKIISSVNKIKSNATDLFHIIKEGKASGTIIKSLIDSFGLADSAILNYVRSLIVASTVNATAAGTTGALGMAFTVLKTAILGAKDAILAFMAANPVGWVLLAVAAIAGLIIAYNKFGPTHKNFIKKLEEETKSLEEIKSNLESLNSELKTTKERIEELENKGPLSLTESEELENLKQQNAELERQIRLEEAKKEAAQNRQAEAAAKAFKTDTDFKTTYPDGTKREFKNKDGDVVDGTKFDVELRNIEVAKENVEKIQSEIQDALDSGIDAESKKFKKLEEKLESAQNDLLEVQTKFYEDWDAKNEEYGDLEWFSGYNLTKNQKEVNSYLSSMANYLSKADILTGVSGAKSSVLDRILGEKGSDAGKKFKNLFDSKKINGSLEDVTKSVESMLNDFPELKTQLDSFNISAEELARYLSYGDTAAQKMSDSISVVATDISSLTSAYESYTSALQVANEVAFDGQVVSEDSYETLSKYLKDVTVGEEDFSDAVDVNNGKIIKNTKLLRDLIAQKKKEQKATVSAAKAQSQLQYTKIVKQLQQAVKAMSLDYKAYGYVTQATYQNISALREQIKTIQNAIREYALLELKLSDVTKGYTEFENAKSRDAELTYGDSWIESIQALNDGLATGKIGTETFQAAVDLLVPKEVYESLDDYQERLIAIHDYVDKNPLFADWFTIDDNGNFGIEFKNMAAFVQDMQAMDVFTGNDITGFNFADGIETIDDIVEKTKEWNNGVGVTKETIVAMLTELSKYDARYGQLLERITTSKLDRELNDTTTALDVALEKQEQFFKDGKDLSGADADEYNKIQQEINSCSDALEQSQQKIINNANAWAEADNKVNNAKNNIATLSKELEQLEANNASSVEIQMKADQVDAAKKSLAEALQAKASLEEPSQLDIQLAFDDVQSQIEEWKKENSDLDINVVPKLEQDENGVWQIPAEIETTLSDADKQKLEEYKNLINKEEDFASLLGLIDTESAVDELSQIKDVVSDIDKRLGGKGTQGDLETKTTSDGTKSVTLHGNKTSKENIEKNANKETNNGSNSNASSTTAGFAQDGLDQQIAQANERAKERRKAIAEAFNKAKETVIQSISQFFTEEIPQALNNFFSWLGEKLGDVGQWAQGVGQSIGQFFTETIPQAWNSFTDWISSQLNNFAEWGQGIIQSIGQFFTETIPQTASKAIEWVGSQLSNVGEFAQSLWDVIVTFFTDTLPQKWTEFWDNVDYFCRSVFPYYAGVLTNKVYNFFTETIPQKWNEFWDSVGEAIDDVKQWANDLGDAVKNFFLKTLPQKWDEFWDYVAKQIDNIQQWANDLKDKVVNFFTETLPEKWSEFWDGVSKFVTETIPAAATVVWNSVMTFFTETIPNKWNEFWDSVSTYISDSVVPALEVVWNTVVAFFTETIPTKWNEFWNNVSTYISENIIPALKAFKDKIVTFFTETVTEKWNAFLHSVETYITETVPNALETIKTGITTFFTETLPSKIGELWDGITSWIGSQITSFWDNLKSSWNDIKASWKKGWNDSENGNEYSPPPKKSSGNIQVLGNANAKGNAHAQDKPGLKKSEKSALLGELGPEMVVDPNKGIYYTVGENGPVMQDLPRGAIIFNHKQTRDLLQNGQTNTRGTIANGGLSFATGNAHASYYSDGYRHGLFGGYLSDDPVFKDTSRQWVDYNKNWVKDYANASNGIVDSLSDAADSISDAADDFEDTINWIDVLFTRVDDMLSEHEGYLATIIDSTGGLSEKDSVYNAMFDKMFYKANKSLEAANYYKDLAEKEMNGLDENTKSRIRMGTIDIEEFKASGDEATTKALEEHVDKINKAIEYYDQISQYTQQYYSTLEEIADKAVDHQGEISTAYENEIGLVEHLNNALSARNDLEATKEGFANESYYKGQIDASQKQLEMYRQERKALQDVLDQEVALGHVKIGSQQWFDMQEAINDADDAIIDMESSIEDLQNAINDLYWDRFDELINRFGYLEDEISNVVQLLSHDPDGLVMEELKDLTTNNWATGSGLASLGLYAQQMEEAQYVANQYAEQIKELKKQYASGRYNETEYLSKLNELIGAQYDNIEKYYDAKDAIIDLNKTRVDAIKDGIQKEIDAYDELINKKKDLLNKEQELHDFQDEISEKEKNVSDIRKQLAAMAGDTTQATTAKRKQLEADLIDAQKELEDSYYSHSMSARSEALDKEFSDFEDEKNKEIEKWEDWLEDTERVVSETLNYVKSNTNEVFNTLKDLGSDYNLTMSDSLITPWENGSNAIDSYSENFGTAVSNFTEQLDEITLHWQDVTTAAEEAAAAQAKALQAQYNKITSSVPSTINSNYNNSNNTNNKNNNNNTKPSTSNSKANTPSKPSLAKGSSVTVKTTARRWSRDGGNGVIMHSWVPGSTFTVMQVSGDEVLLGRNGGYTGWVKKSDLVGYASGLKKAKNDHLAITDELGPELKLIAGPNGSLEYVKYGSSILPSDISSKLVDIASDPTSIFDNIKTNVKVPNVETKDFNFDLSFDSLLHIDNATKDSIPELKKMIRSEFNDMLSQMNSKLKRV